MPKIVSILIEKQRYIMMIRDIRIEKGRERKANNLEENMVHFSEIYSAFS